MNQVIISVGSNIEPDKNIAKAGRSCPRILRSLPKRILSQLNRSVIRNSPIFLNGAVLIRTDLKLEPLRQHLKKIEDTLGRRRGVLRFGPRTVDLDIIVWNGKLLDPDFYERDYLKKAVLELMPDLKY